MICRVWSSQKRSFHGILKSFAGDSEALMGTINNNLATPLVDDIDPQFVVRSVGWFEKLVIIDNNLGAGSFVLLKIMHKVNQSQPIKNSKMNLKHAIKGAFNGSGSPDATAWLHQARKHILQFATGTLPPARLPQVRSRWNCWRTRHRK